MVNIRNLSSHIIFITNIAIQRWNKKSIIFGELKSVLINLLSTSKVLLSYKIQEKTFILFQMQKKSFVKCTPRALCQTQCLSKEAKNEVSLQKARIQMNSISCNHWHYVCKDRLFQTMGHHCKIRSSVLASKRGTGTRRMRNPIPGITRKTVMLPPSYTRLKWP